MTPIPGSELWERVGSPRRVVAVVAHPDDESFGLGGVLGVLVDAGASVSVVCLTHGEASTLGAVDDLGSVRDGELRAAARVLGVGEVELFDHPDGHLAEEAGGVFDAIIDPYVAGADLVVVFEPGGVTGHPDHRIATAAGERAARRHGVSVLEWGVHPGVAATLRRELGAPFVPLEPTAGTEVIDVEVDRVRQLAAIACHGSQATDNPVLARRLALQGRVERVRYRPRARSRLTG